jgi:hypothetical protein
MKKWFFYFRVLGGLALVLSYSWRHEWGMAFVWLTFTVIAFDFPLPRTEKAHTFQRAIGDIVYFLAIITSMALITRYAMHH